MLETPTEIAAKIPEQTLQISDSLSLDIEDEDLVKVINKRLEDTIRYYQTEKNLYQRQETNEKYFLGDQIDKSQLKSYQVPYVDNLIYEALNSIKPIALSRLPDLVVRQVNETPESKEMAEKVTKIIDSDLRQDENREVLGKAFLARYIYFFGAIKARWDHERGKDGDYVFEYVHPSRLIVDHTGGSPNPAKMSFIAEKLPVTIKEVLLRFPDRKDKFIAELGGLYPADSDLDSEKKLATVIDIWEVHFTWFKEREGRSYEKIEGVCWKYKQCILKKMKDPNYDYQGEKRLFIWDEAKKKKREPQEPEIRDALIGGVQTSFPGELLPSAPGLAPNWSVEEIYHNHLESPIKPYYIMVYDQLGKMPLDETTALEQAISGQDIVNKTGRQIVEMTDKTKGKDIFTESAGITKEDAEQLSDPTVLGLLVKGNPGEVHGRVDYPQPGRPLFENQTINRNRVFSLFGVHDTTRGQKQTHTATVAQILREADYGRIDDLTANTINPAAAWMANVAMQLIKLRYTQDHWRWAIGKDGVAAYLKVNRDMVQDGMQIVVVASGSDRVMRQRRAFELAKSEKTDPLTFFEDLDLPNPKERAERLLTYLSDPATYITKYLKGLATTGQQVQALAGQPASPGTSSQQSTPGGSQPSPGQGQQQALNDIVLLQQGQKPPVPAVLDPDYLKTLENFLQSPDFQALDPQIQSLIAGFAQEVIQKAESQAGGQSVV